MSENDDQDKKDFEFIREQVIEKKKNKSKKRLLPFLITVFMAILFGLIAAFTFVLAEPSLYKLIHKEGKTPISFPTKYPEVTSNTDKAEEIQNNQDNPTKGQDLSKTKDPVIVEKSIDADLEDYVTMYEDLKGIAHEADKALVKVSSIISEKDWFNKKINRTIHTTGIIIANNGVDLLVLVSLDRVKDASSIKLQITDRLSVNANLQDYESDLNLAVVAAKLSDIPELSLKSFQIAKLGESYNLSVGSPILALGSPNGHQFSMEIGNITSNGDSISITDNKLDLFNTSIKDNQNSDGIIVDMNGDVIGLITRTLKSNGDENLNTVIGISKIKKVIELLANKSPRIYCGIKSDDMTDIAKIEHNIRNGIYVNEVLVNSPAFNAGMKNGDIILKVDNLEILSSNYFYNIISTKKPGENVTIKIKRTSGSAEKEITLKVNLVAKKK